MIEIPESKTLGSQLDNTLKDRKIDSVLTATNPHKFAWFNGDSVQYAGVLEGKRIVSSSGHGMFVDIQCEDNVFITISDGTSLRYCKPDDNIPDKYQLLITLDDNSFLVFTIAMYGGIWAFREHFENEYYQGSLHSISPLDNAFDENKFEEIFKSVNKDISVKALLATEQRIPGLGNGVLQDILFNAGIHPKRKKSTLSDADKTKLFQSIKHTLQSMTANGGRDTEKDLFGQSGGYKTLLSKNTLKFPCPRCGDKIIKEAYMGGAVYYCPTCQRL